ncbi:MAG: dihydrofolate reductase [Geobacteraceae bacterium]|nr:dihydrofolate reductase [Geobacteraceae bacterium]
MNINIIAAMAQNRVIGCGLEIPWRLPDDMRRFRETTWGHPVIMGRRTFESFAGPLPGRTNIVLSRDVGYRPAGTMVAGDLEAAVSLAGDAGEVFICGGEEVYRRAMSLADRIYLTVLHRDFDGDVFFPEIPADFVEGKREFVPGPIPHTFFVYQRKRGVKEPSD